MNYYDKNRYNEQWYINFKDMKEVAWHVSIQSPDFTGTATQLIAGAKPFEWMGNGDEDQTKCILGSTGTLRIIVDNNTLNNHLAALRPTEINNRRVVVSRNNVMVWQGFLAMEEYNQPWESVPYELELPVRSVLDLANDMTFPPISSLGVNGSISTTANLLRYIISLLGGNVDYIATNHPYYVDFNGKWRKSDNTPTSSEEDTRVHWSVSFASPSNFYEVDGLQHNPRTLADALETILYPYGRIYEVGNTWMVRMDGRDGTNYVWWMAVSGEGSGSSYFSATVPEGSGKSTEFIPVSLNPSTGHTAMTICGTDNNVSKVSAPGSVTFEGGTSGESTIFELTKDMIIGGINEKDAEGNERMEQYTQGTQYNTATLELEWNEIQDPDNIIQHYHDVKPSRIIKYTSSSISDHAELGMRMRLNTEGGVDNTRVTFNLPHRIRSVENYNLIKLSIYVYNANGGECDEDHVSRLRFCVNDGNMYWNGSQWNVAQSDQYYNISSLNFDRNNKCFYTTFNEYRGGGSDMTMRNMMIGFDTTNANKFTIVPKLEYIEPANPANTVSIHKQMFGEIKYNKITTQIGGSGEELDIKFKTAMADLYAISGSNTNMPWAGFCDARAKIVRSQGQETIIIPGYIDTQDRKKLEIGAASTANPVALLIAPWYYYDSSDLYMPVAVGMDARDCTLRLRMITTNL